MFASWYVRKFLQLMFERDCKKSWLLWRRKRLKGDQMSEFYNRWIQFIFGSNFFLAGNLSIAWTGDDTIESTDWRLELAQAVVTGVKKDCALRNLFDQHLFHVNAFECFAWFPAWAIFRVKGFYIPMVCTECFVCNLAFAFSRIYQQPPTLEISMRSTCW